MKTWVTLPNFFVVGVLSCLVHLYIHVYLLTFFCVCSFDSLFVPYADKVRP